MKGTCAWCGREFEKACNAHKYCCRECRLASYGKRKWPKRALGAKGWREKMFDERGSEEPGDAGWKFRSWQLVAEALDMYPGPRKGLCKEARVDYGTVCHWANGYSEPKLSTFMRVLDTMGLELKVVRRDGAGI